METDTKKNILIVEDEEAILKPLLKMFRREGFGVLGARNGEEGLTIARRTHPDLILLDIILPKMDGFTLMQELKDRPATAAIPIIVLTNLEDSADIERALGLGATTFLVKTNYQLTEIVKKIEETLSK